MKWTRKELKMQAKEALQRNYWRIVLVSFLALIFCSGLAGSGSSSGSSNVSGTAAKIAVQEKTSADSDASSLPGGENNSAQESSISAGTDSSASESPLPIENTENKNSDHTESAQYSVIVPEKARMVGITLFVLIMLTIFVFVYILAVLLLYPFQVGVSRFMIKSIDDTAEVREITYGFDHSYKNIVKTMFHYDIRIFLWCLLFIIPGIYKDYQYRLVPYILAEHPDMHYRDVLRKSADLMKGHKWKAFLLDLSFIPWHILGLITCGIVEIFYVSPYCRLTDAALYRRLSGSNEPALITLPPKQNMFPEERRILPPDTQQI